MRISLNASHFPGMSNVGEALAKYGVPVGDGYDFDTPAIATEATKAIHQANGITLPSIGIGDTLAKVFKAVGVASVVEKISAITGKPCGCKARQDKLNQLYPY